ncbi:MAG: hypothetical protein V3R64_07875 [Sphingomonadales bacterium]
MANNLFIAYDLMAPNQNYDAVIVRIKELGDFAHIQLSRWSVKSGYSAAEAHEHIRLAMDANDRLAVIVAEDGFISKYDAGIMDVLRNVFQSP